ncbi:related to MEF2-translation elongation factor, mitochondrial [Sporisorium reilianum SRZ2]|uniref:Related to MEF2-translation elongation factor, mitochondrial n=1 Tax=Sporisorium reilianum (strain SRZ2) TaxID=999809 RepID=E6ZXF0_SPORE|nr:related to MEF2-translation elongation factor, mitochondrial [Sporisorium reilianum SRZ2]
MSIARRCTGSIPRLSASARRASTRAALSRPSTALHATLNPLQRIPSHLSRNVPASVRTFATSHHRYAVANASAPHAEKHPIAALRNISIIAHIDAGKTTLTERLLHLTNALNPSSSSANSALPGDVDSGSTVTDFLEQERQRGITIQSAAVGPVWWPPASSSSSAPNQRPAVGITLVDTPGHIDFGIEVERALRVVDGAVVVLDGVEGVEAQTENVWAQAARYDVRASLLFINKLDRMGSSVAQSLRSVVRSGMHARPLLLQLPVPVRGKDEPGLAGLVDLVEMQTLTFAGKAGEVVASTPLSEADEMYAEAKEARHALVECLASLDEQLLEELFGLPTSSHEEPHAKMPAASLKAAIRRQTLAGSILPVLCGSAAKNVGVQPLLDAISDFLPSPADKPAVAGTTSSSSDEGKDAAESTGGNDVTVSLHDKRTTALAFKVVHDKRRGPTTFVRVYSGTLQRSTVLFNTTTGARERLSRVLFPFADQYVETATLRAGQIGVILGLRDTRTGDTLVDVSSTANALSKTKREPLDAAQARSLRLKRVHIPPPVFSMSLEPASKSDVDAVSEALNVLIRTDPSLRLDESREGTTGQTVLSGMGELHLEIAKDRLANEFGVNARMGAVRVSYRETLDEGVGEVEVDEVVERELAGKKIKVGARVRVRGLREGEEALAASAEAAVFGGNVVRISFASGDGGEVVEKVGAQDEGNTKAHLTNTPRPPRNKPGHPHKPSPSTKRPPATPTPTIPGLPPGIDLPTLHTTFQSATIAALSRGPLTANPLMNLHLTISHIQLFGELSSSAAISYLLSHLVRKALRTEPSINADTGLATAQPTPRTTLMEPMMSTRITLPEAHLGKVINDITAEQDGVVQDVVHLSAKEAAEAAEAAAEDVYIPNARTNRFELQSAASAGVGGKAGAGGGEATGKAEIHAVVPLANLVRYSSKLRALTAGNAQFSMQLQGFAKVSKQRQAEILHELGR